MIDSAVLSALSALGGSAVGAMSAVATTWLTQHSQNSSQRWQAAASRRERLYGDFIDEASALFMEAITDQHKTPPDTSKYVSVFGTVAKLRLFAPNEIVVKAEEVMARIAATYYGPRIDLTELANLKAADVDILAVFSEACRGDLDI